jgi:hypothetical protein
MRKRQSLKILLYAVFLMLAATSVASACSCPTIPISTEAARKYYQNEFRGAAFTGKITSVKQISAFQEGYWTSSIREVIVDVDLYWLGVDKPQMTIYTAPEGTSCSLILKKDETYFFRPSLHKGHLFFSMCDQPNWGGRYPSKDWADYTTNILGPAKSFEKVPK